MSSDFSDEKMGHGTHVSGTVAGEFEINLSEYNISF